MTDTNEVTQLVTRAVGGDRAAAEELIPQMYTALRALAQRQMQRESRGQTLQATALVNEAYLRLIGDRDPGWNGRGHFYGAAAEAMRRILVERARRRGRIKHGGDRDRVPLDDVHAAADEAAPNDIIALDESLRALEAQDARAAQIVMLRYFAGLDVPTVAQALELSERSVRREWRHARLWLYDRMTSTGDETTTGDLDER